MGSSSLVGMLEVADVDTALRWHLSHNHYPPVPDSMVAVCKRAIRYANQGRWNTQVTLPVAVSFRGARTAPVREVVSQHHLEAFLAPESEC